jgi:hypothetical protein
VGLREMPGLDIGSIIVEPDYEALIPTLRFKIQVINRSPNEPITHGLLSCNVYLSTKGKDIWIGKFATVLPVADDRPLPQMCEVVERFTLAVDVNNAISEYLKVLEGEDLTFKLFFEVAYQYEYYSGGVRYSRFSTTFSNGSTTLAKVATLPIDKWKRLLSTYYRNLTWIAISKETYLLLKERVEKEGLTLDEIIRWALIERR